MMKEISINLGDRNSKVYIGECFADLNKFLPKDKVIVITDKNIIKHYGSAISHLPQIEIGLGEENKNLKTIDHIMGKFIEHEVDRSWFVLAVGGGIVCDVAGFAASIYMRGLRFGFVSTTLLSQVDASVGGKNGVNFTGFKNMVGVFNQPEFVLCDPTMLNTLNKREVVAGFAEIVKAGIIRSASLFDFLEENAEKALDLDSKVITELVYQSVLIKAKVVENDEREKGERRILNFGHTFGHAFEKMGGILHGEAVSIGMVLAAKLSNVLCDFSFDDVNKLRSLLMKLSLPVDCVYSMKDVISAMKKDKKREGDKIHLVLIDKIGNAYTKEIKIDNLEDLVYDLC
jgi:3-dehydroquinate synthase